MSIETLFYRQPRLLALALLVLIAAGASALTTIGRQEDPSITNLTASVTTIYPGADPARVESLVTRKIETELNEIAAISSITSSSSTGFSRVSIELDKTIDTDLINSSWSEVRAALDSAELEFPVGVLSPDFSADEVFTYSAIVALTPTDGVSVTVTQRYAQLLADRLSRLTGTYEVDLFGEVEEEILIELEAHTLGALGLTVGAISSTIEQSDAKVRAGRLHAATGNYLIEVTGEIKLLDKVRDIPLVASNGAVVRLGDVASISQGVRKPLQEIAFHNGERVVLIAAKISNGRQVDAWMSDVQTTLSNFKTELPRTLQLETVFDQSEYTADRLQSVAINMAIGMGLVILVLLFTLGIRPALIVAMVLPLVSLASVATMNAINLPIHQMSLTGLIVALGLLVDAAIVMTDEIRQRLQAGDSRLEAVQTSVRRLFAPLLASTLTTALSFLPMVLLPGGAGDFVGAIAIAVILMLSWSFVIAVTITAAMAGRLLKQGKPETTSWTNGISGGFIAKGFRSSLLLAMRYPLASVAFALVLPVLGFASASTLSAQFFPGVDRNQFFIKVDLAPGTPIELTREYALLIDEQLRQEEGIEKVSWLVGKSAPSFYYNMVGDRNRAPEFAQALVTTRSAAATAELVPHLQSTLSAQFLDAKVLVQGLVQGPPVDAPVEIRLIGPKLDTLREYGDQLRTLMANVESVTTVQTSLDRGAPKVVYNVNEDAARLVGLNLVGIANQLESSLEGVTGGSLLDGTREVPVRVRVGDAARSELDRISSLPLIAATNDGSGQYQAIPLSAIAEVSLQPSQGSITRRDGERVNTVQAFIAFGVLPEEVLKNVQTEIKEAGFTLPPGYRLQTGGDSDARDDTLNNLLAPLGLIITLSIASIVMTFNSWRLAGVTLVVAVLCAGLSMLSLAVFRYPFGIQGIIGVIGSIGVSINAAIIILTGLQANPSARAGDPQAMVDVVMGSSRHILSTTITTVGGFLPLILDGGEFWPPFAMSVAGGVLLSSIVSFYFTPPMFRIVYARRNKHYSDIQHRHGTALPALTETSA